MAKTAIKTIGKALLWYGLICLIWLPFAYGKGGVSSLLECLGFVSFGFWSQVLVILLIRRHRHQAILEDINNDLVWAICFGLVSGFYLVLPLRLTTFNGQLAAGASFGGASSKLRQHPYLTKQYMIANFVTAVVCGVALIVFFHNNQMARGILLSGLALPFSFAIGQLMGFVLGRCIKPMLTVWHELKALGFVLGGYALGYVFIAVLFLGFYEALLKADPASLKGLPAHPNHIDYWFFSLMVLTTLGSDVSPQSTAAKLVVSVEVLLGIAWTVVVFAAVLTSAQRMRESANQKSTTKPDSHDTQA